MNAQEVVRMLMEGRELNPPRVAPQPDQAPTKENQLLKGRRQWEAQQALQQAATPLLEGLKLVGGVGTGLMSYTPEAEAVLIGAAAKLFNPSLAKKAEELAAQGHTADSIWQKTGTYTGPGDGKARQEISDFPAKWSDKWGTRPMDKAVQAPLGKILDHEQLFKAYPQLMNTKVVVDPSMAGGQFDKSTGIMRVGTKDGDRSALSSLLHEVQHWVQTKEGFYQGGNKELAKETPEYAKMIRAAERSKTFPSGASWDSMAVDQEKANNIMADLIYRKMFGEAESRAVQSRQTFSPEFSKAIPPLDSYDRALEDLIKSPLDY